MGPHSEGRVGPTPGPGKSWALVGKRNTWGSESGVKSQRHGGREQGVSQSKPSVTCPLSSGPRQLALKALNERLKRVEDQSVWPSMDDDEEEAGAKVDNPLSSDKAPTLPGKGAAAESSLITFEAAPLKL